jgi:hypothetical protein
VTVCHETAAPGRQVWYPAADARASSGFRARHPHLDPGRCPSSSTMKARHEPTLIAVARSQMTASSPRGYFSQAELTAERVKTRFITRSPVSSAQLKVSHRELAAVGEMGVPINVGSWRVWRVIQHESCPWGLPGTGERRYRGRSVVSDVTLFADPAAFCGDASARLREHPAPLRQLSLAPGLVLAAIWTWQRPCSRRPSRPARSWRGRGTFDSDLLAPPA